MVIVLPISVALTFLCALAWHDQPARSPENKSPGREADCARGSMIERVVMPVSVVNRLNRGDGSCMASPGITNVPVRYAPTGMMNKNNRLKVNKRGEYL